MNRETNKESKPKPNRLDITSCLLLLGVFWVLLLAAERVFLFLERSGRPGGALVFAAVLFAVAGASGWRLRRRLYELLSSLQFAVALLFALLLATAAGTLIIQNQSPAQLEKIYGPGLSRVFMGLRLDDIFHSFWFGSFLVLLMLSLVLAAVRRKMWKPGRFGLLLVHLGVAVVVLGGFIGFFFGFKGFLDLHEGESADKARVTRETLGNRDFHPFPGFALKLEDFQVEFYEPEFKLYVYKRGRDGFRVKRSFKPDELSEFTEVAAGFRIRVKQAYPDFYLEKRLKPAEPGKGRPACELVFTDHGHEHHAVLFSSGLFEQSPVKDEQGVPVKFFQEPPEAEQLARYARGVPARHVIKFHDPSCCPEESLEVEPGKTYSLAGGRYQLKVLSFLPDFVYDMETKKPESRSDQPRNPALQVILLSSERGPEKPRWLFANMPGFSMHGEGREGPSLIYEFKPGSSAPPREYWLIGETREVWLVENGEVKERASLPDAGPPPFLKAAEVKLYDSAVEEQVKGSRSSEWKNPALEIEYRDDGNSGTVFLAAGHQQPWRLPDGRTVLTFEKKPEEAKAYRSLVSVWEGERKVLERVIEVNHPLTYKGYKFYQSSYRKEDPTYSGIEVVKDPGLPLVWAGFLMLCWGVVQFYYVDPRVSRRRGKHGS